MSKSPFPTFYLSAPIAPLRGVHAGHSAGESCHLQHVFANGKCDVSFGDNEEEVISVPSEYLSPDAMAMPAAGLPILSETPWPITALTALKGMRSRIALYRDGKGDPQPGALPVSPFELAALAAIMDYAARANALQTLEASGHQCPDTAYLDGITGGWWKGDVVPPRIKHGERIHVELTGQVSGQFENKSLKLPCEGWLEACEVGADGLSVVHGAFRVGDGNGGPAGVMHPKFRRL